MFKAIYLTNTKNLLDYNQLSNLLEAVHRSDTADFLFVLNFEGQGQSIYFAILFRGGVPATARPGDSPSREFESTVPHLLQLSIKPRRLMERPIKEYFTSFTANRVDKELTDIFHKALASPETNEWDSITRSNKIFLVEETVSLIHSLEKKPISGIDRNISYKKMIQLIQN